VFEQTIAHYEAISRQRPLDDFESAKLERAVRQARESAGGQRRPWLPEHDQTLIRAVRLLANDGKRRKRRKIPEIAAQLGRSTGAVRRRLTILRQKGKAGYISPVNGTGRYSRTSPMGEMAQAGV
jgi:hypothetical protein